MNAITQPDYLQAEPEFRMPTRLSGLIFAGKAAGLRAARRVRDAVEPVARLQYGALAGYPVLLAESVTPLWSDTRESEAKHQFGKVENLRRAARTFDALAIPAGEIFSFWKQLGRPTRGRGFVVGRMLQEGCMVSSTGGGLCQISNALYEVAQKAGTEIVERHPHSRRVPGSSAQFGRDATVAWNYVDFRFRAPQAMLLRVIVMEKFLVVRLLGEERQQCLARAAETAFQQIRDAAHDCGSCGQTQCYRHEHGSARADIRAAGRTAFLLDEAWPEFRDYVRQRRARNDLLAIPLDGNNWNRPRYAWETEGFAEVETATVTSLIHAALARRSRGSTGARVAAQMRRAEAVAKVFARSLTPDVTEICVAQSLLPFLWQRGVLAGRRITVLMTRLPMQVLEARLDTATLAHPDRATLADFRAPLDIVAAEAEALAAAERIVTPHAEIAKLFPGRAGQLDWIMPDAKAVVRKAQHRRIAFPGPSLPRKGAHELRAAALRLDLEVVPLGHDAESATFWRGLAVRPAGDWQSEVAAVVQPALVEEQPRALLAALAAGIPVIATPSCGIAPRPGLTLVAEGDVEALTQAISALNPGSQPAMTDLAA